MPNLAVANGLEVEDVPQQLQDLTSLETIFIARRIPFMKLLALPRGKQRAIHGCVVNIPVEPEQSVAVLPRIPSPDAVITGKLKRKLQYRGHVIMQNIRPYKIKQALHVLKYGIKNPHYEDVIINDEWEDNSLEAVPDVWNALTQHTDLSHESTANSDTIEEHFADKTDQHVDCERTPFVDGEVEKGNGNNSSVENGDEDMYVEDERSKLSGLPYDTSCTHAIYLDNSSYDKIHSPFFKNGYYENDVICAWRVRAPPGQRIKLTFHALSIDGTNGCDGDYVSVGEDRLYCNNPPANGYFLTSGNDVNVTFVSKPGSRNIKPGGFNMSAAAEDHSPMNVHVTQLNTAFNISWEPPYAAHTIGYIVRYKLTSDTIAKDVMVSADRRHFVLSTWPHYGREFALDVLAVFPNYTSPPAGPYIERSKCSRNITVTGSQQHLNSPHYPQPYEPGTICEWNVTAHAGHKLVLTLDHVDLGTGDVVKITNSKFNLNIDSGYKPSLPIMTEDVFVKFVSDDTGEGAGFRLNIGVV